tara:strand:- start:707 stop:1741 length:1035 start_codon:yes stop_codon:yes gene_type:complete
MKITKSALKQLIKEELDMTPPAQTQSVLGDEDLDSLDQDLGMPDWVESGCDDEQLPEWAQDGNFVNWLLNSPDGDRARAAYEAEKAARGAPAATRALSGHGMTNESVRRVSKSTLKQLIKEELEEQEKPEYKGNASAASRLKKSIGSDEEPADEPAAKKEKSPLEKAKDRLARAKAKGEPARIKSAEAAVKREKKKAGLPESIRRVSKSTLYRIIQEELQNVMEQRPQIPDDAFDFPDDSAYDAEGGEAATPEEAAAYEKKRGRQSSERQKAAEREMDQAKPGDEGYNQSTQGNWKANAYMQAGVGRGAFEAALAPAKPEVKAALLKAFDAKNFKAIKKWALGR